MNDKVNEFLKKLVSNEETLKRIALYLFIICIFIILIFFKLNEINKNIVSNSNVLNAKDEQQQSIKDVYIEDATKASDVLPILGGNEESSTANNTSQETESATKKESDTTTSNSETEISTSNNNNSSKSSFVININSNKIHYADCSFVNRMKEENRKYIQLSNSELNQYLNNGYTLCSACGG